MATTLGRCFRLQGKRRARLARGVAWLTAVTITALACGQRSSAQAWAEIHRSFVVKGAEPVTLEVDVDSGELQILYGRDGVVSVSGTAKASSDVPLDDKYFSAVLTLEQAGNHFTLRHVSNPGYPEKGIRAVYRIDVPYRTEVISRLSRGKQSISGIVGPVRASTGVGDIKVSYISKGLQAQVDEGNLDIQVIGERVEAKAGAGNISCSRVAQGVHAETGDGDITLMVVGPSTATVKKGSGRIDVGGARGSLVGSTDSGDLHVRAIPHDDWQLSSVSGNVRLELPSVAKFDLEGSTDSGEFRFNRDDIAKWDSSLHALSQRVNGGGNRITVHTGSGRIAIL